MSTKKRIVIEISVILAIFIIGVMGFLIWNSHHSVLHPGECKKGYVDYGIPLGCISQKDYDACHNGTQTCPVCLSSKTEIATNDGPQQVTNLKIGDLVWSKNANNQKVLVPIKAITKRPVPEGIKLLYIKLADARHLLVSPNHPSATGELFKNYRIGDVIDNSVIKEIVPTKYNDGYTYDILPSSDTGQYWANDILVGSTL